MKYVELEKVPGSAVPNRVAQVACNLGEAKPNRGQFISENSSTNDAGCTSYFTLPKFH